MAKPKPVPKAETVPLLVHFPREMKAAMMVAYGSRGIAPRIRELVQRDLIAQASKGAYTARKAA